MPKRYPDSDQELTAIKDRDREERRAQDERDAEGRRSDRQAQRIPEAVDALRRYPGPLDDRTGDEVWLGRLANLLDALKDAGKLHLLEKLPNRGDARRFTHRSLELLAKGKRQQAVALLEDVGPGKLDAELAQERNADLADDLCRLLGIAIPEPPARHPSVAVNDDRPADAEPSSERKHEILLALLRLRAGAPRCSVSRLRAARKADAEGNAASYNGPIASLVHEGLVQSKKGPGGGIWLTAKGKALAEHLTSSRRE